MCHFFYVIKIQYSPEESAPFELYGISPSDLKEEFNISRISCIKFLA